MKFILLLFISASAFAYDADRYEHMGLIYIFGDKITKEIESSIVLSTNVRSGILATYDSNTHKIYVDKSKLQEFRARLSIVHEGMHYYQRVYLTDARPSYGPYVMTTYEPAMKLSLEKEAELARGLALLWCYGFMPEPIFLDYPQLPDTYFVRDQLWMYLEMYMGLTRPVSWFVGSK